MIKTLFTTFTCVLIIYNLNYGQISGEMIKPADGFRNDQFGFSVALHGSSYLVGAIRQNNKGVVYTSPNSKLPLHVDLETGDQLGFSISCSHTSGVALVGAPLDDISADSLNTGAVYSYYYPPEGVTKQWYLEQKLLPAERYINGKFGNSVSVSGSYAIIGAPGNQESINKLYPTFAPLIYLSGFSPEMVCLIAHGNKYQKLPETIIHQPTISAVQFLYPEITP